MENTAVQVINNSSSVNDIISPFSSPTNFESAQRMAMALSTSSMVPDAFRVSRAGKEGVGNCLIAFELAHRLDMSPVMVMQEAYVIHGKPAFSSKFVIACLNASGKFSALRFVFSTDKNGKKTGCKAVATEKATGELLEGPEVTIEMARQEGWSTRAGSKWQTMPEIMLRYRAASFFAKLYAPEILMGIPAADELQDEAPVTTPTERHAIDNLNKLVKEETAPVIDAEAEHEESATPEEVLGKQEQKKTIQINDVPENGTIPFAEDVKEAQTKSKSQQQEESKSGAE